MQTFGALVRKARKRVDMTQVGLAQKAKVDPGTVARIERDEQRPSARVKRVLVRILGMAPERET